MKAETPLWMREKLRRCGIRSIDPVVDITNYVLLELGQPMHAFDLDRIDGGIVVRMAKEGNPDAARRQRSDPPQRYAGDCGPPQSAGDGWHLRR